jgi:sugar lactone lactonase YvrE
VSIASGTKQIVSRRVPLWNPIGIVMGDDGGLYVADADAFGGVPGAVMRIDPRTGKQVVIVAGNALISPTGIAMAGGRLFVVDYDALVVIDPHRGAPMRYPWSDELSMPWAIAIVP